MPLYFKCIKNGTNLQRLVPSVYCKDLVALSLLNYGGDGGIRTLAPFYRSTPLAGEPLQPTWVHLHVERLTGLEPATARLEIWNSTIELQPHLIILSYRLYLTSLDYYFSPNRLSHLFTVVYETLQCFAMEFTVYLGYNCCNSSLTNG